MLVKLLPYFHFPLGLVLSSIWINIRAPKQLLNYWWLRFNMKLIWNSCQCNGVITIRSSLCVLECGPTCALVPCNILRTSAHSHIIRTSTCLGQNPKKTLWNLSRWYQTIFMFIRSTSPDDILQYSFNRKRSPLWLKWSCCHLILLCCLCKVVRLR